MCSTTFLKQKFGNAFLNVYCSVGKEIFINFTCGLEKKKLRWFLSCSTAVENNNLKYKLYYDMHDFGFVFQANFKESYMATFYDYFNEQKYADAVKNVRNACECSE